MAREDVRQAIDPCEAVTAQLLESMALLAAYNDVTLLNSGLDGKAYDAAIGKLAGEILGRTLTAQKGGKKQGGGYHVSADLGVRASDCKLVGKDRYEDVQKKACLPEIIFDAVIPHEIKHVKQCESDRALFIRGLKYDPVIQSRYEIEAYCTEIGMLFKWLDRNCEEDFSEQKKWSTVSAIKETSRDQLKAEQCPSRLPARDAATESCWNVRFPVPIPCNTGNVPDRCPTRIRRRSCGRLPLFHLGPPRFSPPRPADWHRLRPRKGWLRQARRVCKARVCSGRGPFAAFPGA